MFTKEDTNKVKGIAIMLLLFHHTINASVFEIYGLRSFLPMEWVVIIASQARCCVWIFIFLSAYGMQKKLQATLNIGAKEYCNFVKRRWFSLMLPFFVCFLIRFCAMFLIGKDPVHGYDGNFMYILLDFFGIADLFETPMLTGVHWYMCMAQILILIMPLLSYLCRKFDWLIFPLVFVLLQYVTTGIKSQWGGIYIDYLPAAVLGVLFAQNFMFEKICSKAEGLSVQKRSLCFMGLISLLILLLFTKYMLGVISSEFDSKKIVTLILGIIPIICCIIVVLFCKNEGVLYLLGKYSGLMFLVHTFFTEFFKGLIYFPKWVILSWLLLLLLSLMTSVVIAFLIKSGQTVRKLSLI